MQKAYFNWSSGKDSSLALYKAQNSGSYEISVLFTAINRAAKSISMHETPLHLVEAQAMCIGIPLVCFEFDASDTPEIYQSKIKQKIESLKQQGITTALFGDIYLTELRNQREKNCRKMGIDAAFPLWGMDTKVLMKEFIDLGFKSIATCVDTSVLDKSFLGRIIDYDFISDFPAAADVCGENGEYHSFVFDGPIFKKSVNFEVIKKYYRDFPSVDGTTFHRYWYLKLQ